ncbi:MAG: 3-phosphoserine/phosphohydroxythreonine transaminase [Lentisphaeria bacterium]|nr:3-phosphoserine/phosphohydroxythreonine transaminase [Lentisphaeria bacterium]
MKVFNFNAGPAMLPPQVMEKAQKEFCNYDNTGCGILEHSHRAAAFQGVLDRTNQNIRDVFGVPENYDIVYIQGGASLQFAMIPMNLMQGAADYADTGTWSSKAMKEAKAFGEVRTAASSKETKYDHIPAFSEWKLSADASYVHITSNNTIYGTQYQSFPKTQAPLIADMSSDIMSRRINVADFGMIYAGAQKNLGPSGLALVIIRKDLVGRTPATVPTMLRYSTYTENNSLYNTPPTFGIYMIGLVTEWMKEVGGLEVIEKWNDAKAALLYKTIDESDGYFRTPVHKDSRSKMNVVFRMPTEELEAKFLKVVSENGMIGLKGHRSVGGLRASIYNAMPLEGVEKLVDLMTAFRKNN